MNEQQPQQQNPQQGYQGYNNQYYQNYYGQQQPVQTAADMPASRTHANKKFLIAIGIVVLLVIGFVGIFLFTGGEEVEQRLLTEPTGRVTVPIEQQVLETEYVNIEEVKLCSFIDENYNCNEKPEATFSSGEEVYVYLKVSGFEQIDTEDGYLFGLEESIDTVDPEGRTIDGLSGVALDLADFSEEKRDSMVFKNKIPSANYLTTAGTYTINIRIKDKITGVLATKTANFIVGSI